MEPLGAVAHAEHRAELAEAPRGEAVARRQQHLFALEPRVQRAHAVEVVRVARVEAPVALANALVRRAVHVVGRPIDRRQAAGEERLAQPLGREREVRAGAEAAEALPEDAPALDAELLPDPLRVADDRVGAVQLQVLGLLLGAQPGQRRRPASSGRCRAGRAAALGSPSAHAAATRECSASSAAAPRSPARPGRRRGTAARDRPPRRPRARRP